MFEDLQLFIQEYNYWLKLLTIPVVAGAIGWFTNWQAIEMTFYPLEFWGIKIGKIPIGWQGIIPANGVKMANISVDLMTEKLISIEEIISKLNPDEVAKEMAPQVKQLAEQVVNDTMQKWQPTVWKNVPNAVKSAIFNRVAKDTPQAISAMMQDVKDNVHELLDLKKLCVDALLKDKSLVNEIFLRCGEKEFKFIILSGWWFGLIFGIPQMILWHFFPWSWTLPVAGILVGYITNWLALKLIFNPLEPKRFLFWTILGLFIKRQKEVAAEYGKIVAEKILNSENIWEHMLSEKGSNRMYALIEENVNQSLDRSVDAVPQPLMTILENTKTYQEIRTIITKDMVRRLPDKLRNLYGYTDKVFDIETIMRERLQALSPKDFVGVLRPAFEEEEFKLILVGAILGGLAGFLQWGLVFGGLM